MTKTQTQTDQGKAVQALIDSVHPVVGLSHALDYLVGELAACQITDKDADRARSAIVGVAQALQEATDQLEAATRNVV